MATVQFNAISGDPVAGLSVSITAHDTTTPIVASGVTNGLGQFTSSALHAGSVYDFTNLSSPGTGTFPVYASPFMAVAVLPGAIVVPPSSFPVASSLPSPTTSGVTVAPTTTNTNLSSDVSAALTVTNVPTSGNAWGVAYWYRQNGTTIWVPYGDLDLAGMPTPAASQTMPTFVYGQLVNGMKYDFAIGYVGVAGYGPLTTIATAISANSVVVTAPYLIGTTTTPVVAGGASVTSAASVNGLSATLAASFSVTNQPGDGSLSRVSVWYRQNGTSAWTPSGSIPVPSVAAPPSTQAYTFDICDLTNGVAYDVGCSFENVQGGEGSITLIGTATAQTIGIPTAYMLGGASVTPVIYLPSATPRAAVTGIATTLNVAWQITNQPTDGSLSRIALYMRKFGDAAWAPYASIAAVGVGVSSPPSSGAYAFDFNDLTNGVAYDFGCSFENAQGGESVVAAILTNQSAQPIAVSTPYLIAGSNPTPTVTTVSLSNSSSTNGISAAVTVNFTVTNQPTDGSLSRISMWFRTTGTTPWTMYASQGATGLPTPSASQAYSIVLSDLTNGQNYDFGCSYENAQGADSNIGTIQTAWTAQIVALPTSALPGAPGGASLAVSAVSLGTYAGTSGAAGYQPITFTPTVTATPAFSTWGAGYLYWMKINDTGTSDGDTNVLHYAAAGSYSANTSGSAVTNQFGPVGAGHGWQFALQYVDQRGAVGALVILGVMPAAQTIGTPTLGDYSTVTPTVTGDSASTRTALHGTLQLSTITFKITNFTALPAPSGLDHIVLLAYVDGDTNPSDQWEIRPDTGTAGGGGVTYVQRVTCPSGAPVALRVAFVGANGKQSPITALPNCTAVGDPNGAIFDPADPNGSMVHVRAPVAIKSRIDGSGTLDVSSTPGPVSGTLPRLNHHSDFTTTVKSGGGVATGEVDGLAIQGGVVDLVTHTTGTRLPQSKHDIAVIQDAVSGTGKNIVPDSDFRWASFLEVVPFASLVAPTKISAMLSSNALPAVIQPYARCVKYDYGATGTTGTYVGFASGLFPMVVGKTYTLSMALSDNISSATNILVGFADASGSILGFASHTAATNGRITYTYTPTTGQTQGRVQIMYNGAVPASGNFTFYIAGLQVEVGTVATSYKSNEFDHINLTLPYVGHDPSVTGTIQKTLNGTSYLKSGAVDLDVHVIDGATHGRPLLSALTSGQIDLSKTGVINKTLDNVTDGSVRGAPLLTALTSGQVDLAKAGVINKSLDNVADGSTRGAPLLTALTSGQVDLSKSGVISKVMTNIADDSTRSAVLTSETAGSAGSRTVKQINDGTSTRTAANVASVIDGSGNVTGSACFKTHMPQQIMAIANVTAQWASTSSTLKIWATDVTGTTLPIWTLQDGTQYTTSGNSGVGTSSSSPIVNLTGQTANTYYWYVITWTPSSGTNGSFTATQYLTKPTDAQLAAAVADGALLCVFAQGGTTAPFQARTGGGGGIPGGGGGKIPPAL